MFSQSPSLFYMLPQVRNVRSLGDMIHIHGTASFIPHSLWHIPVNHHYNIPDSVFEFL